MAAGHELVANLSDANISRRLRAGIVSLALGLALAVTLDHFEVPAQWRVGLFVPFFISANAFFQGALQTCGFSAWAGMRMTGCGSERIANRQELESVRARGLRQVGFAVLSAAALTVCFMLVA